MEQVQEKKPGFFKRLSTFFSEVRAEMKKVTWPTKPELYGATVVVIAVCIAVTILLAGVDTVFGWIIRMLLAL